MTILIEKEHFNTYGKGTISRSAYMRSNLDDPGSANSSFISELCIKVTLSRKFLVVKPFSGNYNRCNRDTKQKAVRTLGLPKRSIFNTFVKGTNSKSAYTRRNLDGPDSVNSSFIKSK